MREAELATLRLALTPGVGPRTFRRLLDRFGSAQAALEAPALEWKRAQVEPRLLQAALRPANASQVTAVREQCMRLGIEVVPHGSANYPELLATIFDPPAVIFLRGHLPGAGIPNGPVGIVGTRKPSNQGLSFAYKLSAELSEAGAVVVSGLATGIDAEAHRAVVDRGGVGIGVLAGGVESVYPQANRKLAESLCERGCLLSEHPPGTAPRAGYFVGRNRLISGLSRALAVIEAGAGSGALLTANFAMEEGRSVFVMPGRPGDPRVAGGLPLLHDGANLLLSSADIAAELGLETANSVDRPLAEIGDDGTLFAGGGVSFDDIMAVSGLTAASLLARLSRLELAGRIRRGTDGFYYRN